jgi:hypothetical protein
MIAAALGFVFQIDDALGGDGEPPRRRVEAAPPAAGELDGDEEHETAEPRARREQ